MLAGWPASSGRQLECLPGAHSAPAFQTFRVEHGEPGISAGPVNRQTGNLHPASETDSPFRKDQIRISFERRLRSRCRVNDQVHDRKKVVEAVEGRLLRPEVWL